MGICCLTLFLRRLEQTLLTPNRQPPTNQSMDTTNVQHGKPMSFMEITEIWVRNYSQEQQ